MSQANQKTSRAKVAHLSRHCVYETYNQIFVDFNFIPLRYAWIELCHLLLCGLSPVQWSRELGCSSWVITLGQSIVMCVRPSEPTLAGWAVQAAETSEAPEERRRYKGYLCRDGEEKDCASVLFINFARWKGECLMSGPGSSSSVALGASSVGSSDWLAPPPGSGSSQVVSQNYSLCSCMCIYLILFIFCVQNWQMPIGTI